MAFGVYAFAIWETLVVIQKGSGRLPEAISANAEAFAQFPEPRAGRRQR